MAGLQGTVTVPGAGKIKKTYALAGVAVVAAAVVWYWARRRSPGAAAAVGSPAAGGAFPPDGTVGDPTDPNSTDPATGLTYGQEGQLIGTGQSPGGTGDGGGGGGDGGAGGGPPFPTNDAWARYVLGYYAGTRAGMPAAIGLYLAGRPVTHTQESLINEAVSIAGPPPVAGTAGYPPGIHVTGSKQGGGTTARNPVTGLHVTPRYTQAEIRWHEAAEATSYRVIVEAGRRRVQTQNIASPAITLHDLHERTAYTVRVLALPTNSAGYSHEAHASFRTKGGNGPRPAPNPKPRHGKVPV